MVKALIPVVNEQDEIVGYKLSNEVGKEDIYRVSALWSKTPKAKYYSHNAG